MKKFNAIIAIFLLISIVLCSCGKSSDSNIDGTPENVSAGNENATQTDEFFSDQYTKAEETTVYVAPENKMDYYGARTYISPDHRDENPDEIYYDGKDIVIYTDYHMFEHVNMGIRIYLNGILQDVIIEKNGEYLGDANACVMDFAPEEQSTIKMTFKPNIGSKGDVLKLTVFEFNLPDYVHVMGGYMNGSTYIDQLFIPRYHKMYVLGNDINLVMQTDADSQTSVNTSFSGAKITEMEPLLKKYFNNYMADDKDFNRYDHIYTKIWKNIKDTYDPSIDNWEPIFEAERSDKTQFDVVLFGRPGTVRVGLYVNGILRPVFDGAYQTDVRIEQDKQTTLTITLDTTGLGDHNALDLVVYDPENGEYAEQFFNASHTLELK